MEIILIIVLAIVLYPTLKLVDLIWNKWLDGDKKEFRQVKEKEL